MATASPGRSCSASWRWSATFAQCWRVLLAGDADAAEALAVEALQLGTDTGQPDTVFFFGVQLSCIRWHQGRDSESIELVEALAAENPHLPAFRAALARLCVDFGREDQALSLLRAEAAAGFP